MIAFTVVGIALVKFGVLAGGKVNGTTAAILFVIAGILCIAGGIALWCAAVFGARIDIKIKSNRLATGSQKPYPPTFLTKAPGISDKDSSSSTAPSSTAALGMP